MEQLVVLAIIGLLSLINWAVQKSNEKRTEAKAKRDVVRGERKKSQRNIYTQPPPVPTARKPQPPRDPFQDLMEALGLPPEAAPPSPIFPRELAPPVIATPLEDEEFASLEEEPPKPHVSTPFHTARERQLAAAFSTHEAPTPSVRTTTDIRSLLSNRTSQRQAILIAEILGTPRGLARADQWGI